MRDFNDRLECIGAREPVSELVGHGRACPATDLVHRGQDADELLAIDLIAALAQRVEKRRAQRVDIPAGNRGHPLAALQVTARGPFADAETGVIVRAHLQELENATQFLAHPLGVL